MPIPPAHQTSHTTTIEPSPRPRPKQPPPSPSPGNPLWHRIATQVQNETRGNGPGTATARWLTDAVGDILDARPDEARLDAQEELAAFMARQFSETGFHPADGDTGLFDATYDPAAGKLTIQSRIHFQFGNGDPTQGYWREKYGDQSFRAEEFQWDLSVANSNFSRQNSCLDRLAAGDNVP